MLLTSLTDTIFQRLGNPPRAYEQEINDNIRYAIEEFCRESGAWQYDDVENIVADTAEYVVTIPDNTAISDFLNVMVNTGTQRYGLSPAVHLQVERNGEILNDTSNLPSHYWNLNNLNVRLYPIPSADITNGLEVKLSLYPTSNEADIPGGLFARWQNDIVEGALGKLKLLRFRPWADPEMAMVHAMTFRQAIERAKVETFTGPGFTGDLVASNPCNPYFAS